MKRQLDDPYPERQWCPVCGWRKCGKDSWNGKECECGYSYTEPPVNNELREV